MIGRLSGRVAVLLSAAAVLLVVLVGWLVLVSPQRSKAADLSGQIDETQAQLFSTQAYVKSSVGRRSVGELRKLRRAVPDDVRMSEILRQLSAAASQSAIQIDSITPQTLVPVAGAQAVPISLSVEGHYFNLAKFLDLLGTRTELSGANVRVTGRLYAIDGIQFGAGGSAAGSSTGLITATINLDAFVFGGAPASSSSAGTTPAGASTDTSTTSTPSTSSP